MVNFTEKCARSSRKDTWADDVPRRTTSDLNQASIEPKRCLRCRGCCEIGFEHYLAEAAEAEKMRGLATNEGSTCLLALCHLPRAFGQCFVALNDLDQYTPNVRIGSALSHGSGLRRSILPIFRIVAPHSVASSRQGQSRQVGNGRLAFHFQGREQLPRSNVSRLVFPGSGERRVGGSGSRLSLVTAL